MKPSLPVIDDTKVWDVWLSAYQAPCLSVALEVGLFDILNESSLTCRELAQKQAWNERVLSALLPMLTGQGFLFQREGKYQLTETARNYLLKDSPFYWGNVFGRLSTMTPLHQMLSESLQNDRENSAIERPADGWESGEIKIEDAKVIAAFMNSHSMGAAYGLARTCDFSGVKRLLDVGAGSGCFSIALAQHYPDLRCTVMDLPTMCQVAEEYIARGDVGQQVDTVAVDMFRQDWPTGYDALFFSNVFHDWDMKTCAALAKMAFDALEPGGRIFLHEMLLDDDAAGPEAPMIFSAVMAMGTMGQQFSFPQLKSLLTDAGFSAVEARHSYGYYSLVSAEKAA